MNTEEVEKSVGYKFKNKELLKEALTLSSFNPDFNNEKLEFFGDAILQFIVSERIYGEAKGEGELTELRKGLVCGEALAPVSLKLGLDRQLIKGMGDTNNDKAIPSAYEAILAAIYFDGGMDAAKNFVSRTLDFTPRPVAKDPKTLLQELLQKMGEPLPDYKGCCEDIGTPQAPRFRVTLTLQGKTFTGEATKKQDAEKQAAQKAYEYLNAQK